MYVYMYICMHAPEVVSDVPDTTLLLPAVNSTHTAVVVVLNMCVGAVLSHSTREDFFFISGEEMAGIRKHIATGRIYFGS
jgi:hypothetical protein